ncbi:MAG: hypothetical protein IPL40_12465 [Proteobacteria bacterium]|nr:hypothetical protein [Pseudomonadota bacterium]
MRALLLAVALLLGSSGMSGCIVPAPGYRVTHQQRRSQPRRCTTACAGQGQRRVCQRRCRIWRNGICASYRESCRNEQFCRRHVTRCR